MKNYNIQDILYYINVKLKIRNISIKTFVNIIYLIEWEYCYRHNYKFFNYKWYNIENYNIANIKSDFSKNNILYIINGKYESLLIPKSSDITLITGEFQKVLDTILDKEFILNKASYYFNETLTFDLFYDMNKMNKVEVNICHLVKMKKNKEY